MSFNLTQWLKDQAKDDTLPILPLAPTCTRGGTATIDDNREWLVSNGLGTYASASISGANTRRYHGLLVASLTPPVRRTVLLSRLDERTVRRTGGVPSFCPASTRSLPQSEPIPSSSPPTTGLAATRTRGALRGSNPFASCPFPPGATDSTPAV